MAGRSAAMTALEARAAEDYMVVDFPVAATFDWDYASREPQLRRLYEQGKASQWNAVTDIDWSAAVEFGQPLADGSGPRPAGPRGPDCPVPDELWHQYGWEFHAWMTSQFLHGEQGALIATARLVETVPGIDNKLYAASQVADEARHVEAFSMYMERLGHAYPVNPALAALLSDIMTGERWDLTYLGMQIVVEGLALAAFRLGQDTAPDPVIRQITRYVARDEARHVAYGVLALRGLYDELTSAERAVAEEFVMEASLLMARRFRLDEVWERLGIDVAAGVAYANTDPGFVDYRRLMFAKIVTNLEHLGLLTGPVRAHLRQLMLMRGAADAH